MPRRRKRHPSSRAGRKQNRDRSAHRATESTGDDAPAADDGAGTLWSVGNRTTRQAARPGPSSPQRPTDSPNSGTAVSPMAPPNQPSSPQRYPTVGSGEDRLASMLGEPGSRRRRLARWAAILAIGGLAVLLFFSVMILRVPGWYAPPAIEPDMEQYIRDDAQYYANAFGESLMEGREFAIELTQEQINQWITMRERIWPESRRLLPDEWRDPFIRLEPDRITLAARYEGGAGSPIISATISLRDDGDAFVLKLEDCRIGSLPAPRSWIRRVLGDVRIDVADRASRITLNGTLADGVTMNRDHTWWNGRQDYRVMSLEIREDMVVLVIRPTGRRTGP